MNKPTNPNPCDQYLSDKDYLLHMIPHHQVAVDISIEMQQNSTNPVMQDILRQLIWTQNREIMMMKDLLNNLPDNISSDQLEMDKNYRNTILDFTKSASDPTAECNPEFFDPQLHKKHMSHMKLDEKIVFRTRDANSSINIMNLGKCWIYKQQRPNEFCISSFTISNKKEEMEKVRPSVDFTEGNASSHQKLE